MPKGEPGAQRLDWESLSQRIHPAASRVNMLAETTPAMFIAFDLLARGDRDLQPEPFAVRRAELVDLLGGVPHPVHVTRTTDDPALAERWLAEFEGAGLDGVVAKPLAQPYAPNKRTMFKIKHARTADVVALGYRIHKSGQGVGSLLVGLYSEDGQLYPVGGVAAWSNQRRLELIDELAPLVQRDEDGAALDGRGREVALRGGPPGLVVRQAAPRARARGALRPARGLALPPHRAVRALASRPRPRVVHVRPARDGVGLRPRRRAGLTLSRPRARTGRAAARTR